MCFLFASLTSTLIFLLILILALFDGSCLVRGLSDNCRGKNQIALTFDDGPKGRVTRDILKLLNKYDLKATFFVQGTQLVSQENIAVLKQAFKDGHTIGSHTWSHSYLTGLSDKQIKEEMDKTADAIYGAIGVKPRLMRPPYGDVDDRVRRVLHQLGYLIVGWSVDLEDWRWDMDEQAMTDALSQLIHKDDSAIILMHDIKSTSEALQGVIRFLRKTNGSIIGIDKCLRVRREYFGKHEVIRPVVDSDYHWTSISGKYSGKYRGKKQHSTSGATMRKVNTGLFTNSLVAITTLLIINGFVAFIF